MARVAESSVEGERGVRVERGMADGIRQPATGVRIIASPSLAVQVGRGEGVWR